MTAAEPPRHAAIDWTEDGQPRSRLFGDVYFSAEDGLAESQAVFLGGCGLPAAWAGRRRFVVGELGFGTGLNIAALLDLWRATRGPDARLHIFTVEGFPLSRGEAARALGRWPALAPVTGLLIERWPGRAPGFHRIDLPELGAILDVAVMDVADALEAWSGAADAWFLDGFSPALNPGMWRDEILALVAARSAPGARAATFTVAGQVRRGLAAAGFAVNKRPGFGRKRERLEARLPGTAPETGAGHVAIVGAGVAGAAAARAVRALGARATVVAPSSPGDGASGNPAALVTPRLDAGLGEAAMLFARAFDRATMLYAQTPGAVSRRGVLQLPRTPRDLQRFERIVDAGLFEPGALALLDADAAAMRAGEPVGPALDQAAAQVIAPAAVLPEWTDEMTRGRVAALRRQDGAWSLFDARGDRILEAEAVIVAAGLGTRGLVPGLPLAPVRGQASWSPDVAAPPCAVAWGGYAAAYDGGVLFGATHDRDDDGLDLRTLDHRRNLETLAQRLPILAAKLAAAPLAGRAGVRAVTPDRLPIAGAATVEPGLFVLAGFGSRGFSLAPLLAEHVAALAMDAPSPISRRAVALVAAERFARRAERRGAS